MSHIRTKGFILRDQPVGDADRLISILTSEYGLITASARGARRQKSPLLASTQVFAFSEFQLFQNRGRFTVDSAELTESFQGLQKDIFRLICAAHLAEVFVDVLKDDLPDKSAYELWGRTANELSSGDDPLLYVHVSELRLLSLAGLKPPVEFCSGCNQLVKAPAVFSFTNSNIFCAENICSKKASNQTMSMSGGTLACLNHILNEPLSKLFSFSLSDQIKTELVLFAENWLTYQMEKKYTRLDMLRDLE